MEATAGLLVWALNLTTSTLDDRSGRNAAIGNTFEKISIKIAMIPITPNLFAHRRCAQNNILRLVHGEDVNPAAAFVVDPDTHHLYTAYGRGNIPQLERQKLMAGTYVSVIGGRNTPALLVSSPVASCGGCVCPLAGFPWSWDCLGGGISPAGRNSGAGVEGVGSKTKPGFQV